jgi:hypothetical protein
VARSPRRNCRKTKMVIRKPNPRMQPQTFESDQGYTLPPHCKASSKQTIEQIKNRAPKRSISKIFCLVVMVLSFRFGGLKKSPTAAIDMAPNGKLIYAELVDGYRIENKQAFETGWRWLFYVPARYRLTQKHHLHETLSVRTPPKRGPTTDEIPNMLDKAAMNIGRLIRGTVKPTIVMPPENNADAPAPATARPTMSITEFLAAAHIIEPNSNRTSANKYVYLTLK